MILSTLSLGTRSLHTIITNKNTISKKKKKKLRVLTAFVVPRPRHRRELVAKNQRNVNATAQSAEIYTQCVQHRKKKKKRVGIGVYTCVRIRFVDRTRGGDAVAKTRLINVIVYYVPVGDSHTPFKPASTAGKCRRDE